MGQGGMMGGHQGGMMGGDQGQQPGGGNPMQRMQAMQQVRAKKSNLTYEGNMFY